MSSFIRAQAVPKPRRGRSARALWLPAAMCCAAVAPAEAHAAVASLAGTLVEAAPFVLAAEVLPAALGAAGVAIAGCGCRGRRLPGALALPATALCWIAFGPLPALARAAAGLALALIGRPRCREPEPAPDAFADLTALVTPTVAAFALGRILEAHAAAFGPRAPPFGSAAGFAGGALLGAVAPCATAGVAIAAGLAHAAPAVAAGVLATAGLVAIPSRFGRTVARQAAGHPAPLASLVLAAALAGLCARGAAGFVHPRLLPLSAVAAVLALAGARRRRTRAPGQAGVLAAGIAAALVAGSPVPPGHATETTLASAYAGEPLDFTGIVRHAGDVTLLERYVISCCRIDATIVAVQVERPLAVASGRWVSLRGTLVRDGARLVARVARWRIVATPADPFAYR